MNTVRKQEHRSLRDDGDRTLLVGTKYRWLESPGSMRPERRSLLSQFKDVCRRTGRAWALKEMASRLWGDTGMGWARTAWLAWAALASRSRLEPMVRAARMVGKHLGGILTAVVLRATNTAAESMNARIQRVCHWLRRIHLNPRNLRGRAVGSNPSPPTEEERTWLCSLAPSGTTTLRLGGDVRRFLRRLFASLSVRVRRPSRSPLRPSGGAPGCPIVPRR